MDEPVLLRTVLGSYPHVAALRDGRVTSDRVKLEFIDYNPLPPAFRLMVRDAGLDLSEMAVVTHLLACHYDRPLVGLAVPLWSRLPHTNLMCPADSPISHPRDLAGTRIGVRAYAQTSGVWVRGILESTYGVDLDRITWGTMEDAHLPEYVDPPNTTRYPAKPALRDLMMQGEFSAIMGERIVDPAGVRTVIPDAEAAGVAWVEKAGFSPINHGAVLRRDLHQAHPWLAAELMTMFAQARAFAVADGAPDPGACGLAANHATIQLLLDHSYRQKITPRRYQAEELFLPL